MLLYYPTPGANQMVPLVRNLDVLCQSIPPGIGGATAERGPLTRFVKKSPVGKLLSQWPAGLRSSKDIQTIRHLYRHVKRNAYDLVHVNNTFTYQVGTVIASRRAGIPVISHVRNPVPDTWVNRVLMRQLTRVVTVSQNYEQQLAGWKLNVPVCTCHDGVIAPDPMASRAADIRRSLVPENAILIGSVGRLDEQKGYDHLIRAQRIIKNRYPNVHLAIAGEGPMRATLEQLVRELDLSDIVHLCGFRTDISDFVSALDLFVSSSRWEGLPIAVVEAMLLRKPVVATDVGGVSEVVKPGETGYLVPANDVDALATNVMRALEETKSGTAPSLERARSLAASLTNPEESARCFEQQVAQVIGDLAREPELARAAPHS
jgi:glycosyltransferase involved in cell wall biosynthesis